VTQKKIDDFFDCGKGKTVSLPMDMTINCTIGGRTVCTTSDYDERILLLLQ
jgi:hypothetical protein